MRGQHVCVDAARVCVPLVLAHVIRMSFGFVSDTCYCCAWRWKINDISDHIVGLRVSSVENNLATNMRIVNGWGRQCTYRFFLVHDMFLNVAGSKGSLPVHVPFHPFCLSRVSVHFRCPHAPHKIARERARLHIQQLRQEAVTFGYSIVTCPHARGSAFSLAYFVCM